MNPRSHGPAPRPIVRWGLGLLTLLLAASCGGGGGSSPLACTDPCLLVVLPGQRFEAGVGVTGAPDPHQAGEVFSVGLFAADAQEQPLAGFSGTVGLATSDPNDPPVSLVVASGGQASFSVTAVTAGVGLAITSVDLSPAGLVGSTSAWYDVDAGPTVGLAVVLPGEVLLPSDTGPVSNSPTFPPDDQQVGTPFDVSVLSVDALGNPTTDGAGTVSVSTGDPRDVEPAPADLVAGQVVFTLTPVVAFDTATVQVSHATLGSALSSFYRVLAMPADRILVLLPTQSIQVSPSGPLVLGSAPPQTTGVGFATRVVATDAFGNIDASLSGPITVSSNDPADDDPTGDPYAVSLSGGQAVQSLLLVTPTSTLGAQTTVSASDPAAVLAGGASSPFNVAFGGAERLLVLHIGQSVSVGLSGPTTLGPFPNATVGVPFEVRVLATDRFGQIDTAVSGLSVSVTTPNDGADSDPGPVTLSAGEAAGIFVDHRIATPLGSVEASEAGLGTAVSDGYSVLAAAPVQVVAILPGQSLAPGAPCTSPVGAPTAQAAGVSFGFAIALVDPWCNISSGPDQLINVISPGTLDQADINPGAIATASGSWVISHVPITARTDYQYQLTDADAVAPALPANVSSLFTVSATADRYAVLLPGQSIKIEADADGFSRIPIVPPAQQTGVSFVATVKAVDFFGNVDGGNTVLTSLSTSDALDTEPPPQALLAGSADFSITNVLQSTSHTLTATAAGAVFAPALSTPYTADAVADRLLVKPPGQSLQVSASGPVLSGTPSAQSAGTPFGVTVLAVDAFGNLDAGAAPDVAVSTPGDGQDTHPPPVALVAGSGSFSISAVVARSDYTVRADDVSAVPSLLPHTSSNIPVSSGTADRLVLTLAGQGVSPTAAGPAVAPPAADLTAGVAVSVGLTATDVFGNRDFGASPTARLDSNDAAATNGGTTTLSGGFGTIPFTAYAAAAGALTLTGSDTAAVNPLASGLQGGLTVLGAGAQDLLVLFPGETQVPTAAGPTFLVPSDPQQIGALFTVTILAVDAFGNLDAGAPPQAIDVTSDDPGAPGPFGDTLNLGVASVTLTPTVEGPILVTATDVTNGSLAPSARSFRSYPIFLGQADGTSGGAATTATGLSAPAGLVFDGSLQPPRLYVADTGNHRVLGWSDAAALSNGLAANLVIGQGDFTSGSANRGLGAPAADGLSAPAGLAVDAGGNLWVADAGNHRVLRFDDPFGTDTTADRVLGQALFGDGSCNRGGAAGAATLCNPQAVAVDGSGNLWVADAGNHRVLRYAAPVSDGQSADVVLGQVDFAGALCNRGAAPTDRTLCDPRGLALDALGDLWVADAGNSRALRYAAPLVSDQQAALVLGHSLFTNGTCNEGGLGAATLCNPAGIALDLAGNLLVGDTGNHRILRYPDVPFSSGMSATAVIGQVDFTSNAPNDPTLGADTFFSPAGLAWWAGSVFAADTGNNRVRGDPP